MARTHTPKDPPIDWGLVFFTGLVHCYPQKALHLMQQALRRGGPQRRRRLAAGRKESR